MGLQQFKMGVASSVMNKDNMSLDSMDTSRLLDLFSYDDPKPVNPSSMTEDNSEQYEKEFDIEKFSKRVG